MARKPQATKAAKSGKPAAKRPTTKAKSASGARSTAVKTPARRRRSRTAVIDVHAHIMVPEVYEVTRRHSHAARLDGAPEKRSPREAQFEKMFMGPMTDMKRRIADMNKMGVDIQVISASIMQQNTYWAEPQQAVELDRQSNDAVAAAVSQHPDRLVGLATVPMQDPKLAARELERAVTELGLKGVEISSIVNGIEIGRKPLWPFWRKAAELGVPVFIHPAGNDDPRNREHNLGISIGQPLEEAYAMSSLIYDGLMDAVPNLKILFAHGGGYLPFYPGRHDHAAKVRKAKPFSDYLKKFYYDSVLFNPDMLEQLSNRVGAGRIMMGTDYPYGEWQPVKFVRGAKKINKTTQDAILGGNAAKLFGISV